MRRTGRREDLTGANPTGRGKAGSKLHLAGERGRLPLAPIVSAVNADDSTMLEAPLEDVPPVRMPPAAGDAASARVHADKAYDHRRCRRYLRRRGIKPRIARRRIESSARPGRHRWTTERTGAWLGGFRRLRIRDERSSERFDALAMLACAVIGFGDSVTLVEGEGIHPSLAPHHPGDLVRFGFVLEPEETVLFQTLAGRSPRFRALPQAHQHTVAATNWLYGSWLRQQAEVFRQPWVTSRPWPTLPDRLLQAWERPTPRQHGAPVPT